MVSNTLVTFDRKSLIYTQNTFCTFFLYPEASSFMLFPCLCQCHTSSLFLFWPVGILMFLPYDLEALHFVLFQLLFWNKTQTFTSWCLIHGWKLGRCWGAHICYYGKTGGSLGSQSHLTRQEPGALNPTAFQHLGQGRQGQLLHEKFCSWCLLHKKGQAWRFKGSLLED